MRSIVYLLFLANAKIIIVSAKNRQKAESATFFLIRHFIAEDPLIIAVGNQHNRQ